MPEKKHPRGAVLMLTMVILLLIGFMATAIFLNTRSELSISRNTWQGREAFTRADSAARLAVLLSRVLLYQSLGDPSLYFSNLDEGFQVALADNFTEKGLLELADRDTLDDAVLTRYLRATAAEAPHLTITYNGQVVATAAVALEYAGGTGGGVTRPGDSTGIPDYGKTSGNKLEAMLVVTATGRVPGSNQPSSGQPQAEAGYYAESDGTHSVVTTIFREIFN